MVPWVFLLIALVLSLVSFADYRRQGILTARSRIWLRLALIFTAVSLYLLWVNRGG